MIVNEQPIVITGASSGIGKATALHLDELGFRVFAGVRKEADGRRLMKKGSDRLTPVLLDVTDANSLDAAVSNVSTATSGKLFGLVNNAGIIDLYSPLIKFFDSEAKDLPGIPPHEVGKVLAEAFTTKKPKAHYLIGPGSRKMKNLARLPVGLRDWLLYKAIYSRRRS